VQGDDVLDACEGSGQDSQAREEAQVAFGTPHRPKIQCSWGLGAKLSLRIPGDFECMVNSDFECMVSSAITMPSHMTLSRQVTGVSSMAFQLLDFE